MGPMQSWRHRYLQWVGIIMCLASSFAKIQADPNLRHWATKKFLHENDNANGIPEQHVGSEDNSTTGHVEKSAISDWLNHPPPQVLTQLQHKLEIEHDQVHRRNAEEVVEEEKEEVVVVGEEEGDDDDNGDDDDGAGGGNGGDDDDDNNNGGDDDDDDDGNEDVGDNGESETTLDVPLSENTEQALQDRYNDPPEERNSEGDSIFLPVSTNNIFEQEPPDDMENRTRSFEVEELPSHHHQGV